MFTTDQVCQRPDLSIKRTDLAAVLHENLVNAIEPTVHAVEPLVDSVLQVVEPIAEGDECIRDLADRVGDSANITAQRLKIPVHGLDVLVELEREPARFGLVDTQPADTLLQLGELVRVQRISHVQDSTESVGQYPECHRE
jgi:hypothetical protein